MALGKVKIPWNKGLKGVQVAWNKGKKGSIPWNKGLTKETDDRVLKNSTIRIGQKRSEEAKIKMSLMKKGKQAHNKGKKSSYETKKKLSESHKGHKTPEEVRIKMSNSHKAIREKNHLWKGGITPINKRIRNSIEYRLWRKAVFERDNYTCIWCGAKNGKGKTIVLNADHIKPFSLFPELRFAIDNGRTLCVECHKTTDTYGVKYKNLIKE